MRAEEGFGVRVRAAQRLHRVEDRVALLHRKGRDAEAVARRFPRMAQHGGGHRLGLDPVDAGALLPFAVHAHQAEPEPVAARLGRGQHHQPPFVEFGVGGRDQAFMPAAVMPAQHDIRHAARIGEAEDALDLPRRDGAFGEVFLRPFLLARHALEEAGGRHLPVVADDDHLAAARDGAERIHRLDLRGLVDHQQVEGQPGLEVRGRPVRRGGLPTAGRRRREELRDRQRRHHEDRLRRLDRPARAVQQHAHRQVAALLLELALQDLMARHAGAHPRQRLRMGEGAAPARQLDPGAVGLVEFGDQTVEGGAVEGREFRPRAHRGLQQRLIQRVAESLRRLFGRQAPIGQAVRQRRECLTRRRHRAPPAEPERQGLRRPRPIAEPRGEIGQRRVRHAEGLPEVEAGQAGQLLPRRQRGLHRRRVQRRRGGGERRCGRRALCGAPIQQRRQRRRIAGPERAEGGARQRLALPHPLSRRLPGQRGLQRRQRRFRIARHPRRRGLRRAQAGGEEPEQPPAFRQRRAHFRQPRHIQRAGQKARVALRGVGGGGGLGQGAQRRGISGPGRMRHRRRIMRRRRGQGARQPQHLPRRGGAGRGAGQRGRKGGQRRRTARQGTDQGRQPGQQPVLVRRRERGGHATPGALRPAFGGAGGELRHRIARLGDPRRIPGGGRQGEIGGLHLRRAERDEAAHDLMQRAAAVADRRGHRRRMGVEPRPQRAEPLHHRIAIGPRDIRKREGCAQLIQHGALRLLLAVQFEAGGAEPHRAEPALHHLQRRELLGHEQHAAAIQHGLGDDVHDGLRLAGAGRPLDHDVAALPRRRLRGAADGFRRQGLAAIGVDHMVQRLDPDLGIHIGIVREGRRAAEHPAADQRGDDGVVEQARIGGGVQVAPHQELREAEQAERQPIRIHAPALALADRGRHRFRPTVGVVGLGVEIGQRQLELGGQLLAE